MSAGTKPPLDGLTGAPAAEWDPKTDPLHLVQFYEREPFLIETVGRFFDPSLKAQDSVILIATPKHRADVEARYKRQGFDLGPARRSGRYLEIDAAELITQFVVNGWPDRSRFVDAVGGLVARSAGGGRRVRAFGEMVWLLWEDGKGEAAIRLEQFWDELVHTMPLSLLCAYPISSFPRQADARQFREICETHSQVIPIESYSELTSSNERLRAIALLQQRARSLETETIERLRALAEQQRLQEELNAQREELAQVEEHKSEFLAMLGHELRNPLSAVQNALATASLAPSQRERALEIARRQVKQLGRLADDLLDVARATERMRLPRDGARRSGPDRPRSEVTQPAIENDPHELTVPIRLNRSG